MATEMMRVDVSEREEDQDHQEREDGALQGLVPEALDRLADVARLVERDAEVHARRDADEPGMSSRTRSTTAMVFAPGCLLTLRNTPRSPSMRTIEVCVSCESTTAAHVLDVDRRVAGAQPPDDDVLHRPDDLELVVRVEVVVEAAHVDVAGRREEVGVVDGAHDLEDGQPLGEELVAVQVHGDLAHLAAVDRRRRRRRPDARPGAR